ncbi:molybdenum cofactor cytidylyltransferase [Luteibacter rhizovicinus]|uniref:Molybdenum cofactor cytidylyltransferase n=1 Tax=Luteibacter rhizovicinus TaxID=242606 RepID=A0A4R3YLG2_9GAMM|nr:nucleotidyltransferase family protein [Luteibacter rhizovicinus]TCV91894.1 molybdenum cofactor cytidylyltransferase [Luteibacter rhizovicinus]
MNRTHVALILAAGGSRRLGRPKQLLTIEGETLVARAVRMAMATAPRELLVITGDHETAIRAALSTHPVHFAHNARWRDGLATSLQAGARALEGNNTAVLVLVTDQIGLTVDHLHALLAAHTYDRDTVTRYGDATGVPVVLRPATLARAHELRGDAGFRRLWNDSQAPPREIEGSPLAFDLDTPDDLASAIALGHLDRVES